MQKNQQQQHPQGMMDGGPAMQMPMPQNMLESEMIGAIKIKDGLFIGDELASTDLEFVVANKVTHIINCAGKQIQNHWEPIGVAYLTFFWLDQDNQVLLDPRDPKDEASNAIYEFIEEALEATESVLVHSVRGQSRATCALACYIMRKYKWSLLKSLEFLNSRRPDLEIRATFIQQLSLYETRLQNLYNLHISCKWDELSNQNPTYTCEELLLRNTFINSQMGPIPPPNQDDSGPAKPRAIKWIDEEATAAAKEASEQGTKEAQKKPSLVTNRSCDDLVHKKAEDLMPVDTHRDASKQTGIKKSIKQFSIDRNKLTGLKNFTELSPDPLALPPYALPPQSQQPQQRQGSQRESQQRSNGGKNSEIKQKRPDDKTDRSNRRIQENRRLENKLNVSKQRSAGPANDSQGKGSTEQASSSRQTADQSTAAGPSNDLFYKQQKDTDRNALSATEDDLWDEPDSVVAEVKAHNKKTNMKVSESDFENDAAVSQAERKLTRQSDMRNSNRGILSSNDTQQPGQPQQQNQKKSNNFINSDRNNQKRPFRGSQKLAEDSMTEQSEDERRFEGHRVSDSQRFRMGSRGPPPRHPNQQHERIQKTSSGGHVTNIINNNNINNIIINDPSKAPPVFHMAAQQRAQGVDMNQGLPNQMGAYQQRPRKQAQQFRSNSLTNKKEFAEMNNSMNQQYQQRSFTGQMQAGVDRRRQLIGGSQPQTSNGLRGNSKTKNIVKKELQKRNESPRSRRQLINNLAGPQSFARGHSNGANQFLAGPQNAQNIINQFSSNANPNQSFTAGTSPNDLTFFDSKIFANGVQKISQRSMGSRSGGAGQINGIKFQNMSADGASQFFNRTGPIKLPHKQKFHHNASQNQSQHVEDMFNEGQDGNNNASGSTNLAGKDASASSNAQGRIKKANNFSNTQPISSHGLQEGNKLLAQSRGGASNGGQPGSRRELPNEKGIIQGNSNQSTRPGTAPQNLNGMLSSNSQQQKQGRPLSPFNKVYTTQPQSGSQKQRQGQFRTGGGMGRGLVTQKRTVGGSHGPNTPADSQQVMQGNVGRQQNPSQSLGGGLQSSSGGANNRQSIRSHSPGQNNFMQHQKGTRIQKSQITGSNGGVFGTNNLMFGGYAPSGGQQAGVLSSSNNSGGQTQGHIKKQRGQSPYDRVH